MKKRNDGFLSQKNIDHDSEQFDYIVELHEYLWRFVRIFIPGAGGSLGSFLDPAILLAEERDGKSPVNKEAELLEELERLRNYVWLLKQGIEQEVSDQFDYTLKKINQRIERCQVEQNGSNEPK